MLERDKLERLRELLAPALEGELTAHGVAELRELLRDDPEAQRYYVRHCQIQAMITEEDEVLDLLEEGESNRTGAANVLELPFRGAPAPGREPAEGPASGEGAASGQNAERGVWFRSLRQPVLFAVGGIAAGLLVAIVIGRTRSQDLNPVITSPVMPPMAVAPASPMPLVRNARLSDGSRVELAPRSFVAPRYSEHERAVELQRGEAHFVVARDERRPFVVTAGTVRIRAVGTAFNVRRAADRVVVTVTEGQIQVYRSGAKSVPDAVDGHEGLPLDAVLLEAGSQVSWDPDASGGGPVLGAVDPSQALAWREGRLDYVLEPLPAVVADLNRYADRPVVLASESLRSLRVTGSVKAGAVGAWLESLPASLPVEVRVETGRYVISEDALAALSG